MYSELVDLVKKDKKWNRLMPKESAR
jgi:hypothetical protein